MDQTAFFNLTYGVYLCTTWDNGRPTGCIANSAMQVTSSPATVAISINHDNYTNQCMKDCGYFAVAVLGETTDSKLIGRFGFRSGKTEDKFEGISYAVRGKLPIPDESLCFLSCKIIQTMETSTHTIFLGEVFDAGILKNGTPMSYAYYHKVLKGKTAPKAPTFLEEPKKEGYICKICGYEYNGSIPFQELPQDWICPVCGMGKEHFEKIGKEKHSMSENKDTWVCTVCGYEYDGDVPFEELPDDWVCPLCGVGKDMFEKK